VTTRSDQERVPLNEDQKEALHHLADLLLAEILAHTYTLVSNNQVRMAALVVKLDKDEHTTENVFEHAMAALHIMFADTRVSCPYAQAGSLQLRDKNVGVSSFADSLWEDIPAITSRITLFNHVTEEDRTADDETYRAMACKVSVSSQQYLCVETSCLKRVFDETDVLALHAVGRIVAKVLQEEALLELKDAKRTFLTSVQHQVSRTTDFAAVADVCL